MKKLPTDKRNDYLKKLAKETGFKVYENCGVDFLQKDLKCVSIVVGDSQGTEGLCYNIDSKDDPGQPFSSGGLGSIGNFEKDVPFLKSLVEEWESIEYFFTKLLVEVNL